jgi:hypothetical protein
MGKVLHGYALFFCNNRDSLICNRAKFSLDQFIKDSIRGFEFRKILRARVGRCPHPAPLRSVSFVCVSALMVFRCLVFVPLFSWLISLLFPVALVSLSTLTCFSFRFSHSFLHKAIVVPLLLVK